MPSRDFRRKAQKNTGYKTEVDKKREKHPLLYIFSVILLVVIVVTFLGSPLASRLGGGGLPIFGEYDGVQIEYMQDNYFDRQIDIIDAEDQDSDQNDTGDVRARRIWREAFDRTVQHTAMLIETEESGILVSDDRINTLLVTTGPYMVNGRFDESRYENTPNSEKLVIREFYREQLLHDTYVIDSIYGLQVSTRQENFIEGMTTPQRSFDFVAYMYEDYPEEKILDYAKDNSYQFIKISLSRILIKSNENSAQEIRKMILANPSQFEELARSYSKGINAENGGIMGFRYFYDLAPDFFSDEDVFEIFDMREGEISEVIEGRFGWMIFRCDAITVEPDLADQEVKDVIKNYIMRYERGKVEDYFMERADTFVENARDSGFDQTTRSMEKETFSTTNFPVNYYNIFYYSPVETIGSGPYIGSVIYNEDLFIQAFSLKPEEISDPILLDDMILVMQLKDEKEPDENMKSQFEYFYDNFTSVSLQMDLSANLIDADKLVDNFNVVFNRLFYSEQ